MAYHAAVPLDSAREPGVSYREIAETDNIVFIYYIFLVPLVIESPQSAAEGRQELCIYLVIFEHRDGDFPLALLGIGVLLSIGICRLAESVVYKQPLTVAYRALERGLVAKHR